MATSNYHRINGAAIKAIRCAVPEIEISLDDEVGYYDDPKKARRLKMALGMDKRRICPSDVTASDLCGAAHIGNLNWLAPHAVIMDRAKIGDSNLVGPNSSVFKGYGGNARLMGSPAMKVGEIHG